MNKKLTREEYCNKYKNIEDAYMFYFENEKEKIGLALENIDLQQRIDKAISLIEVHTTSFGDLILEKQLVKILTDILKGDDTNE